MLANPLAKYAVMNPIFSPSTHPIQPNTIETTTARRFFKVFGVSSSGVA